jgi:hypothetical protein
MVLLHLQLGHIEQVCLVTEYPIIAEALVLAEASVVAGAEVAAAVESDFGGKFKLSK